MRTALRPYMTTGIAIVGASVIAVAPVTAPPPELRAADVEAVDAIRSVHSDVALTGLADALIAAVPQAVAATVTLFTSTIPASAQTLIAAGKFAHLPVLAVNAVILGTMAPVTPFLVALANELPLPLGTLDGVIAETWKLVFTTPATTLSNVLVLMAEVIDDGLSPLDAVLGSINNLSIAIATTVESIQKIIGTLGSSAPFKAMAAAEETDNARVVTTAAASSSGQLDAPNIVPRSLDSLTLKDSTYGSTVTVDASALKNTDEIKDRGPSLTESEPEAADKSQEPSADDATPNAGTDLSDGNKADPGTTGEKPTGAGHDASTAAAKDDTTVGSASADKTTKNESNSDSAANSGGDEGSSGE